METERQATPCEDCPRWMRNLEPEVAVTSAGAVMFEYDGGVFYASVSPEHDTVATGHKSPEAVAEDCPELANALTRCKGSETRTVTKKWLFGLVVLSESELQVCPATEEAFAHTTIYDYFDSRSVITD